WSSGITNATGWSALTMIATPSFIAGSNFHFRTASSAGPLRLRSVELTTSALITSPVAVMVKLTTTRPSMQAARSSAEYEGEGWETGFASWTAADRGFKADTLSAAASEQADMRRVFILIGILELLVPGAGTVR